jgi:hypothetical protein
MQEPPVEIIHLFLKLNFTTSFLTKRHSVTIIITWQIEAAVSIFGVRDVLRKTSLGAGIANQIMLGIIIKRNNIAPEISNPHLNFRCNVDKRSAYFIVSPYFSNRVGFTSDFRLYTQIYDNIGISICQ